MSGITASPFPADARRPPTSTVDNPIDSLEVTVSTPDERAFGRVRGRTEVTVWLAPGYFDAATQGEVEYQFQRLGRLLVAARMREYLRLRSLAFGRTVTREAAPTSERDQHYLEQRAALVAEGSALEGRIRLSATGMAHWAVRIEKGTLDSVDEQAFCTAMSEAGTALVHDQFARIRVLKQQIYDPRA